MPDRKQPPRVVDQPEPCFMRMRKKDGTRHAARIYHRLGILCGEISGEDADPLWIWHSGDQITEAEYHAMLSVANSPKPF